MTPSDPNMTKPDNMTLEKMRIVVDATQSENNYLKAQIEIMQRELPLPLDQRKAYFRKVTGCLTEHSWKDIHMNKPKIHKDKKDKDKASSF